MTHQSYELFERTVELKEQASPYSPYQLFFRALPPIHQRILGFGAATNNKIQSEMATNSCVVQGNEIKKKGYAALALFSIEFEYQNSG